MAPPYWVFHRVLVDDELQASDDATRILDLPKSNYLHALYVKIQATNGGTSGRGFRPDDVLDLVTVYGSASDVLVNLTPQELREWYMWQAGENIPQFRTEEASAIQWAVYPIFFGRWAYDSDYYLPMTRLEDPKIHIKFSPTIAATGFATGTTRISVWALMSMGREPGQYRGTLSRKTIKAFTSAAAGDDETLLTKGNMLRQLMIRAYEAATIPSNNVTHVKFSLNDDETVMYDLDMDALMQWNALDAWPGFEESFRAMVANNTALDVGLSNIVNASLTPMFQSDATGDTVYTRSIAAIDGDELTIKGEQGDWTGAAFDVTADAVLRPVLVNTNHYGLPNAGVLDFAKAGEGNLLNTRNFDKISLKLTQGNAGAAVRVSTEEVRQL